MSLQLPLPAWFREWVATLPQRLEYDAAAMTVALEACRRNLDGGTGGPFGAVVLDGKTRQVLGVGVNLVVFGQASVLHAEIVALTLAQQRTGSYDLAAGGRDVTLYSTAEPCAICLGAIPWSGVNRLVCGARDEDVRAIGFDEGDKPAGWSDLYRRRGITVTRDFLRAEAVGLLERYAADGGIRYGPHD